MTEKAIAPHFQGLFERRALREPDLATICRAEGRFFDHYGSPESFHLDLPTVPGGYDENIQPFMEETYGAEISIDAPYVCELAEVDLLGPTAIPMKDGGYVFENALESPRRLATSCLVSMAHGQPPIRRTSPPKTRIDAAISLVGPWNRNYTHWFQDYLARLEGLEYIARQVDIEPRILIPADASQWMRDSLRAAGYSSERWLEWEGSRTRINRFVVASVRREARSKHSNRRLLYSPTEFEWLRDRIKRNIEPKQTMPHSERIFVSRANATVRRLTNEEATMNLLSDWGFERYYPEEISFAEQVTLFSEAEAIVSPHGSGLMNQIFADEAAVIEIFGPKHAVTDPAIEYYLADLLGHRYGCVQGQAVGCDTEAPLDDLERLLELMLVE